MAVESRPVSGEGLGSLQACLVGDDPEQCERERRVLRKSLFLSVATQSVLVTAIVVIPLFGKPARIALDSVVPLPAYYSHAERRPTDSNKPQPPGQKRTVCRICAPTSIPNTVATHTGSTDSSPEPQGFPDPPIGTNTGGNIPFVDTRAHPEQPPETTVEAPKKIRVTQIDPAMLKVRVEPIYPTLMRQIHRGGQVQLHAIIGTDGAIQSLQAVSGDPGFYQSAMEAVKQWRYRPTILNGKPVEVDTFITVIYNIGG
jgi:periplasmic protein TonB